MYALCSLPDYRSCSPGLAGYSFPTCIGYSGASSAVKINDTGRKWTTTISSGQIEALSVLIAVHVRGRDDPVVGSYQLD